MEGKSESAKEGGRKKRRVKAPQEGRKEKRGREEIKGRSREQRRKGSERWNEFCSDGMKEEHGEGKDGGNREKRNKNGGRME